MNYAVLFSCHQKWGDIMDACDEYARRWTKKEDVEVEALSELIKLTLVKPTT